MHCETFALYSKCLQSLVFYNIIYGGLLTSVGNTVFEKNYLHGFASKSRCGHSNGERNADRKKSLVVSSVGSVLHAERLLIE